jgi:hypothetical protein
VRRAGNGTHDVGFGWRVQLESEAELDRLSLNDLLQFVASQRAKVMHESDARIQLGVARETLLQPRCWWQDSGTTVRRR